MIMDWKDEALKLVVPWLIVTIVLPILTYIVGYCKDRWHLPKSITKMLTDPDVMAAVRQGIDAGVAMADMSDSERRDAVRKAIQEQIQICFDLTVPDSVLNFLIEKVIADRKVE